MTADPVTVGHATAVLGIETSCDETAAAVVVGGCDVRSSVVTSQISLHRAFGGVVPEIAGRAHLQLLPAAVEQALADAGIDVPDAVAATTGPGLLGALVVGVSAAKALALAWDVPFVAVNHLEAHLYAAFLDGAGHTGGAGHAGRPNGGRASDITHGAGQVGAADTAHRAATLAEAQAPSHTTAGASSLGGTSDAAHSATAAASPPSAQADPHITAQAATSPSAQADPHITAQAATSPSAQADPHITAQAASLPSAQAAPHITAQTGTEPSAQAAIPATTTGARGPSLPMIALLVSGGHTMLIEMTGHGSYELLGQTLDDAAGEAFDKVARLLGLGYPGGPVIDRLAAEGDPEAIRFPRPMLADGLDFSFSGLKTAVAVYLRRNPGAEPADVAASFQRAVTDVLETKTLRAARSRGVTSLCLAGGVAANSELRHRFEALDMEVFLPSRAMCTDNAAMVAAAGWHQLGRQGPSPLETSPVANWTIPTT